MRSLPLAPRVPRSANALGIGDKGQPLFPVFSTWESVRPAPPTNISGCGWLPGWDGELRGSSHRTSILRDGLRLRYGRRTLHMCERDSGTGGDPRAQHVGPVLSIFSLFRAPGYQQKPAQPQRYAGSHEFFGSSIAAGTFLCCPPPFPRVRIPQTGRTPRPCGAASASALAHEQTFADSAVPPSQLLCAVCGFL